MGSAEIPVVGQREPCPCGSGRRYKACHGRDRARATTRLVPRPFAGLADECDWIALREFVPAATAGLTLVGDHRVVRVATVLPLAVPGLVRADGAVWLGLQTATGSGDPSRDLAHVLEEALAAPWGSSVSPPGLPGPGPRLQDLLDPDRPLAVVVHDSFNFWVEGADHVDPAVQASLERASAAATPTVRLAGVDAAYWCRLGEREHLRWVLPYEEDALLDALARLRAAGADTLGAGTRLLGTFRAHGLLVPVWDLVPGAGASPVESPARDLADRLADALTERGPLDAAQRRARAGLANRQLTLR